MVKNIPELFARGRPVFSFEFFLPRTQDDVSEFFRRLVAVKKLPVEFVTLTYRNDGKSGSLGIELAGRIKRELGFEVASHLTCLTHTRDEMSRILERLKALEIGHIVALRGDRPKGEAQSMDGEREFRHAIDLVKFIKDNDGFRISVAGYPETHPEAVSPEEDVVRLAEKVAQGADWVTTQLFFDNKAYFDFVRKARSKGISVPIVPGILPITSYEGLKKFSAVCGVKISEDLHKTLEELSPDPEAVKKFGIDFAVKQCRELLDQGAPGIHFYTLNNTNSSESILARL